MCMYSYEQAFSVKTINSALNISEDLTRLPLWLMSKFISVRHSEQCIYQYHSQRC